MSLSETRNTHSHGGTCHSSINVVVHRSVKQLHALCLTMKLGGHDGNVGNLVDTTALIYTY